MKKREDLGAAQKTGGMHGKGAKERGGRFELCMKGRVSILRTGGRASTMSRKKVRHIEGKNYIGRGDEGEEGP